MCGLVVYEKESKREITKSDLELVRKALNTLRHRGPDEDSVLAHGSCVFGHTRLSIVGVEHGLQPMRTESVCWVHNGEIYNHKELRQSLGPIEEESDSAVIGHGYQLWGLSLFEKLDGVFATVLYDKEKKTLVAARDP